MANKTMRLAGPVFFVFLLAVSPASAAIVKFEVALSGANQVPPADTPGVGILEAEFDTETHLFSWTVTYESLAGPPTAMHFHGPGEAGFNAPVAVPLDPPLDSPVVGQAVLADDLAGYLMDGLIYINVHTAAFPGGEIRGQLVPLSDSAAGD